MTACAYDVNLPCIHAVPLYRTYSLNPTLPGNPALLFLVFVFMFHLFLLHWQSATLTFNLTRISHRHTTAPPARCLYT